jgi:hypothetical protein
MPCLSFQNGCIRSLVPNRIWLAVFLVVMGLAAASAQAAELRTWKDSTGQFSIRAKLAKVEGDKVTLEKDDGSEIEIELKKLSPSDQTYVAEQAKADADPFKPVPKDPFQAKKRESTAKGKGAGATASSGGEEHVVVPDWSGASAILVTPTGGGWEIAVGRPVGAEANLAKRPIPVPPRTHFFEKPTALVVNPVGRRAVIGYNKGFPPNEPKSTRLVLCDLEKGKMLGAATQMDAVLAPLALDDSGSRVLMRRDEQGPGNHDRLELWRLGGSGIERVLRWIPHDDLKDDRRNIHWAEFLGPNRVATMSKSGKLTLWELGSENVRPLSFLDTQTDSTPALSPDRKYIAFSTGKDVGVLDVAAAKVVAMQSMPQVHFPVLLFSPSGKRLGCAVADRIYLWDFAKGELLREVPYYGVVVNGQAVMTSDDYVLLGKSVLMDLENQVKLWTYKGAELVEEVGGLCWFVPTTNQQQAGSLVPATIPQPAVTQALQQALTDPNFFVLKPGKTVKLNVDGLPDADQRAKVRAALEAKLKARGFQVGPDGTIELVAATEVGKEREVSYRSIGMGLRGIKTYKVREYIARVKFVSQGLTAWEASAINIPFFARLKPGETMEQHLKDQEKPNYAYFERVELPKLLTRPTAQGVTTLGSSQVMTSGIP